MSAPGTLRFAEVNAKPSAPPVGYNLIYIRTDNVLYLQDSTGTEVALGSASSITALTGEVTAAGPGSAVATVSNAAVIGKVLTGFVSGPNSIVLATDTILAAIQKLQAQVSATSGAAITALTSDVSASGPGSAVATVNSVGGSTAANVNAATVLANAATSANTASAIVRRDGSGNFSAGTITANLTGNASGSAASFTGSLVGDVTGTQGATVLSATTNGTITTLSALATATALVSVGTITTGTWSATTIAVNKGGTGQTSYTDGQLLIGNTTGNTLTKTTLTAGTGIAITNGSGSITIAANNISDQVTKTANYTILSTDSIIFCDTSGGAFTLTLPSPTALAGKMFRIIDTTGNFNANNLTLARSAAEKIEGLAASKILQTNWGWFTITTNGTDWFVG